ncbi:3'(2'),5'-bisphosphate nucleotidase CysQ [Polymorphobacter sp.]|uniref:3'(2'),5'-bisphosphate nucleotidase CysQ n=1 Tax=Polymorphobacter sp. TaxID=1909290 RepID=UPI003F6E6A79
MAETDLALAIRLATTAGQLALGHFHGPEDWWEKSVGNPVSRADIAVDDYLRQTLASERPDDGWLSEETADTPARLTRPRLWVIDPIDGTRDFVRGRTGWAVSLALVENGRPIVAALAAPARDQLYTAVAGLGARLNGQPITMDSAPAGLRLPIDAQSLNASFWPAPWPDGSIVEKPNSLALRMAKVAAGEADAWLEGRTINEWDVAASALIVTEAGGTVTDRHGAPLVFNKPDPVIQGLATATAGRHPLVLRYLQHAMATLAARRAR